GDFADGAPRVAVLGHGVWRSAFGGDATVIGREVTLDGMPHVLVGVMPAGFAFPYDGELWLPLFPYLGPDGEGARRYHRYQVAGRLAPAASLTGAQAQVAAIAARLESTYPATNRDNGFNVVPLQDVLVGRARRALEALFGAVGLLLAIACANIAGLFLARSAAREGELSIRRALGATRLRIAGQLVAEGLVVSSLGGVLGVVLARWGVSGFKILVGAALPRAESVTLDGAAIGAGMVASLVAGLLFAIAPVLRVSRRDSRLTQVGRRTSSSREVLRFRRTLVVAQVALACVLVIGAGLLAQTYARLNAVETGVDVDGLVALDVSLPEARYADGVSRHAFFATLLERVRERPAVHGAAAALAAPLSGFPWGNGLRIETRPVPENEIPTVSYNVVTPGFFEVAGIRVLAGRTFAERDGWEAVIVNRVVAERMWPGRSPVGERVRFRDDWPWSTIVGVVDAVPHQAGEAVTAGAYVPIAFEQLRGMTLIVRTGADAGPAIAAVRDIVRALDPEVPLTSIATIRDRVAETLARPRYTAAIVSLVGLAALFLSCAGVYGVLAYAVAQRRKELGIRLAVGAGPADLRRLVVRDGVTVVAAGVLIGAGASL
ncbi:MAG: ABC transporter permease, partial [Gemmatimonadetes bacterium]|nr:ABC transporter permease [Gemmatimonadota bacterium]